MKHLTKPELTIVILTYNVKDLLISCLESIYQHEKHAGEWRVVVVDNDSSDGTEELVKSKFKDVVFMQTGKNLGFAKGNNFARKYFDSEYVLFLNPDTKLVTSAISKSLEFIKTKPKAGALTCRVDLPDGRMDYSCHRGLPTPWNSLMYFAGIAKVFPTVKLLAGYTASYLDLTTAHPVDLGSGTFFMVRREAGEQVGWWDEDYFWNGEDVEFCYLLKQSGWQVWYYPEVKIIHYKSSSSGLWSTAGKKVDTQTKLASARAASEAMRIFYRKHYPGMLSKVVEMGIGILERRRVAKIKRGEKYE